ncbi:MAG: B12-binding domain-containing protein [Pseudomonadota bacterium]
MPHGPDPRRVAVYGDYKSQSSRLLRIAKRLPQHKLEALAREALQRLIALGVGRKRVSQWELDKSVEGLCRALLDDDDQLAARMVVDLLHQGVAPEEVYIDYLASAAKRLNEWWQEDKASFWQLTVATCRVLAIMRSMDHLFEPAMTSDAKSVLLAGVPGEQHAVSLRMAADIFHKDGWHVVVLLGLSHYALVRKIATTQTRTIGLTMNNRGSIDALSKLIVSLHICRPTTPIFLNGTGTKDISPKLGWMDLEGVSDNLADARAQMNDWIVGQSI